MQPVVMKMIPGAKPKDVEAVRDRRDDGGAEDGAPYVAASAKEARAADDGRGDRVLQEERPAALGWSDRPDVRGEDDAADARHQPGDHEEAMIRTRATLIPARRAASALPPTAYTWRPNVVRIAMNVQKIRKKMISSRRAERLWLWLQIAEDQECPAERG